MVRLGWAAAGTLFLSGLLCAGSDSAPRFQLYISGIAIEHADSPPNSTKVQMMVYARNFGTASTAHNWALSLKVADKQIQGVLVPEQTPYWGRELPALDRALEKTALSAGDGRVGYLYFLLKGVPEAALGGNTKDTPDTDLLLSMQDQAGRVWQTKVNLRALANRAKAIEKAGEKQPS